MIFSRTVSQQIKDEVTRGLDVVIVYGPRQSGKTTLLNQLLPQLPFTQLSFNGEDLSVQEKIVPRLDILKKTVGDTQLLTIDEAQRIENIGVSLKLIHDQLKTRVLVTGSSSFDLANRLNEPLTGRTRTFTLYPLSLPEIPPDPLDPEHIAHLSDYLRFGTYPRVIAETGEIEKTNYLKDLVNNYLYKDLFTLTRIRKPKKVIDLLSALALQIGSQVSTQELCQVVSLDRLTVENYLDALEKMFIIYNLRGFSRNLRKEISKTSKYYFFDLGLRNSLIGNFNPLKLRTDVGQLFENFCVIERLKHTSYSPFHPNFYFWRTWDQKEIDLIEEYGGHLIAWEFKYTTAKASSAFKEFSHTYPDSSLDTISSAQIQRLYNEGSAVRFGPQTGSP